MIDLPDQPLAQRILRAALAREHPPQQLLLFGPTGTGKRAAAHEVAWALMDPDGTHSHRTGALDLTEVEAQGQQILLRDLEEALAQIASRPTVLARRVMIIQGAERLREQDGAHRLLKTLEEPPPLSHILLVSDRPSDLLPTVRSRCLPVPFRPPGWKAVALRLEQQGVPPERAASRARAEGPAAVTATPFEAEMRAIGTDFGLRALAGDGPPGQMVGEIQARMEAAASDNPSPELERLRAEAADLEGKRGGRTAAKRAEDQEKRERRRLVTDGWTLVLDSAAALAADVLAVRVGAEGAVRHQDRLDELRPVAGGASQEFLERAVEEIQLTRSELILNPTVDLAAEALLIRIQQAHVGRAGPLVAPGRMSF